MIEDGDLQRLGKCRPRQPADDGIEEPIRTTGVVEVELLGSGFLEAQVTGDRNLVTLPTAARDFVRFRLQLASGERLDGLEFAIDRGRVTGELAARAENVFMEDGSMDCRYERGHAGRGVAARTTLGYKMRA